MRRLVLSLIAAMTAGTASAQVYHPGQPYIGDPLADRLRDRMEIQRLRSDQQAAFARSQQFGARLTEMDVRAQRQPEPYVPLVAVPLSSDVQRRSREAATTRREATAAGVAQIDDWLDRNPR